MNNYYPNYNPSNYYLNHPYGNQYGLPQGMLQYSQQMQNQIVQPSQSLNGKIVDSEDVVKATEVPIGGYGIFPKADLSEIYIKSWNNNGTTNITTFKPQPKQESNLVDENNVIKEIFERINRLELKLDAIFQAKQFENTQSTSNNTSKEVKFNV